MMLRLGTYGVFLRHLSSCFVLARSHSVRLPERIIVEDSSAASWRCLCCL